MKSKKPILIAVITSLFAVLTVVNMSLANPRSSGENTLDMLEIMTRAFDESEGGGPCKDLKGDREYCDEDGTGTCIVKYYFIVGGEEILFAQHSWSPAKEKSKSVICEQGLPN